MPELPEVETTVATLRRSGLVGRRFVGLEIGWAPTVGGDPKTIRRGLVGRRVAAVDRRGKYIRIALDDESELIVHLRMSGRLNLVQPDLPRSGYERVVARVDDGRELRFHDPRKFGRALHARGGFPPFDRLGPEPLDPRFRAATLEAACRARRRAIKPLLLDQEFLAGLGNIYCDEALWEARVHPLRRADSLSVDEVTRLHRAIRRVLRRGIRNQGTSLGTGQANFRLPGSGGADPHNQEELRVYRRTNLPCLRCATPIARTVVAQRATHFCPACQTEPPISCPE